MSHTIEISDEQYQALEQVAATRRQSIEALVAEWIKALQQQDDGPYYETDDWLRHLGVSEERIQAANARLAAEAAEGGEEVAADADA